MSNTTAILRKSLPYTPPDSLMFDLFSAIQRKAWSQARDLCYELILCDPLKKTYRDLYEKIDLIIDVMNRRRGRRGPRQPSNRRTTEGLNSSDQKEANQAATSN